MTPIEIAARFFDLIHPADGWKCLFVLPDKRHYWFQTSADLAAAALNFDAQGKAVFHGCASFTSKERKQAHVGGIRCWWFDIDAGPGKPYPDAGSAYRALEAWRIAAGLPPALVVVSGGGIHAYWPLRDPLDYAVWRAGADRLRALAQQHGLAIDPGSTIDAARILRPPGTHNRKVFDAAGKKVADVGGEPRPVRAGPQIPAYGPETLPALFGSIPASSAGIAPTLSFSSAQVPEHLRQQEPAHALAALPSADAPSDPALVAEQCPQVRRLRDAHGDLPEPEWYAVLGVLAHAGEAGRAAAHQWSRGDARYNAGDVERKLEQARRNSGPTTCRFFSDLLPGPCASCQYRDRPGIGSPLTLGRANLPAATVAAAPPAVEAPLPPPHPYAYRGLRLVKLRKATDEDPSDYHVVSEYPVTIDELQEVERGESVSAVFRSWEPMAMRWREFSLNLGDVLGMSGRSKMADRGVVIDKKRWDDFTGFVTASTNQHRGSRHYGTRYAQFGWKALPDGGPAFAVGSELLRAGKPSLRLHGVDEVERRGKGMEAQGSLAGYSDAANRLFGYDGMEAHRFMVVSFAAACLYDFTNEPGCALVHGYNTLSGVGKTAAQVGGTSLFGTAESMSIISTDTPVAKFITIGALGNLPVFYDEFRFDGEKAAEMAKQYVLMATLGRDKQRGQASGGLRNDQMPWSTLHISAANKSIIDTLQSEGSESAQSARVFEFVLSLPEQRYSLSEGEALIEQMRANRGHAGRAFIQAVLDNHAAVGRAVAARMRYYEERLGAGTDSRFIVRLFACVDVASRVLLGQKILSYDHDKMMDWAVEQQKQNAARLALDSALDAGAIVGRLINDLVPGTLVMPGPVQLGRGAYNEPVREPRGELAARYEIEGCELLVDCVALRKWMQKNNYPMSQMLKQMQGEGIVKDTRTRRTLGAGWRRATGQTWCVAIDGAHEKVREVISESGIAAQAAANVVPMVRTA